MATGTCGSAMAGEGVGEVRGLRQGSFVAIVSVSVEAAELHGKQTIN